MYPIHTMVARDENIRKTLDSYEYAYLEAIHVPTDDNIWNTLLCLWMELSGTHYGAYGWIYPKPNIGAYG